MKKDGFPLQPVKVILKSLQVRKFLIFPNFAPIYLFMFLIADIFLRDDSFLRIVIPSQIYGYGQNVPYITFVAWLSCDENRSRKRGDDLAMSFILTVWTAGARDNSRRSIRFSSNLVHRNIFCKL